MRTPREVAKDLQDELEANDSFRDGTIVSDRLLQEAIKALQSKPALSADDILLAQTEDGKTTYIRLSCSTCKKHGEAEERYLKGLLPVSYIRARITDINESLEEMGTKGTNRAIHMAAETFWNNSGLISRALQLYAFKTEERESAYERETK